MRTDQAQKEFNLRFQQLVTQLNLPSAQEEIYIKSIDKSITLVRDDLIHPVISGNKWRKLKNHILHFSQTAYSGIASMGGAYSNHLHAFAYVCQELNIPCKVLVYGLYTNKLSKTLQDCKSWNAQIIPITRQQAQVYRNSVDTQKHHLINDYYWIPEGGGGMPGESGMQELIQELPAGFDKEINLMVIASGTGTSVSGLLQGTHHITIATQKFVKMAGYSWQQLDRILWFESPFSDSFAKKSADLISFIEQFNKQYGVLLDTVYTGRLMQSLLTYSGLHDYEQIFFIHTGGLQANRIN